MTKFHAVLPKFVQNSLICRQLRCSPQTGGVRGFRGCKNITALKKVKVKVNAKVKVNVDLYSALS